MRASKAAPHRSRRARWLVRLVEIAALVAALVAMRMVMVATARLPNGDVVEYHTYALNFWTGHPLFTSLPVEYPPLAILPFSLTLAPPLPDFQSVFTWWAAAAVIVGYLGYLRFSDRKRAIAYFVYLVIGSAGTLVARFDIFPALVTLAALWAAQRRHYASAYLLLAVGTLLKLYPAFLAPLILIAQWRTLAAAHAAEDAEYAPPSGPVGWLRSPATWRVAEGAALFAAAVGLGFALAFMLDPSGAMTEFTYASARPLQVESTPATLLWLGSIVGIPAHPDFSFVSLNYVGALDVALKPLSTLALAAGCLWAYVRVAQGRLSLAQGFLAALSVVVATNKIFSPQYLIWVTPFVAEVYGFEGLWLAICALTTLIFPYLYGMRNPIQTVTFNWAFMPVVAIRNILLLSFALRAILSPAPPRPHAAPGEMSMETPANTSPALAAEQAPDPPPEAGAAAEALGQMAAPDRA
ncbi:MAG TPA: glycosyltransferase family 87 protein [Ktedonobacterales bacterium]